MFERSFCQSDVVLGCAVCSHLCVVNYTGGQAFVVKRALVFVTAIALYLVICVGVIVGISYFLVVFVDDRFHVVHTAVANFDVILVEKAVVFVLFREVLRNKIEKCSADVSLDVFTERRVVPDDISLSFAPRSCRLFVFVVGQCFRICVFVGGVIGNSSVDGCWYLFYDVGRVVGLCVDVLWMVVWLSVRAVGTVCEVEGDVQVVTIFMFVCIVMLGP